MCSLVFVVLIYIGIATILMALNEGKGSIVDKLLLILWPLSMWWAVGAAINFQWKRYLYMRELKKGK